MGIVTCDIAVSADGYGAGLNQSLTNPIGEGAGEVLHSWMFENPDEHAEEVAAITSATAYIMGRNMFSPGRGDWDANWTGWWGDTPPYHAPVFVLTHYPREPITMQGGTTFHFVTDGIESALAQARAAAGNGDVAIAGGPSTINQYLDAELLDELRLHIVPTTLGAGERIFDGVRPLKLESVRTRHTNEVTHTTYRILR